ncbi:MAG: bacterial proteasome activator family protein [Acidimicrobiales bacterium]
MTDTFQPDPDPDPGTDPGPGTGIDPGADPDPGQPVAPDEVLPAPSPAGSRLPRAGGVAARPGLRGPTPRAAAGEGVDEGEQGQGPDGGGVPEGDGSGGDPASGEGRHESVDQPAKVMRIGSMVKQLLDEVRQAPLDEAGRSRLREIYEMSVRELATGLSPDLASELDRMALPFDASIPSEAELRIAQAQLVGWLEGLFHGIQASLMAQQMAARAQLDEMRQRGLPSGAVDGDTVPVRPGTYL